MLREQLEHLRPLVERRRDEHERRLRLGLLEERLELVERPRRRLALALRREQRLGLHTTTTRRGAIIGSVRAAATSGRDAVRELIAGRHLARVNASRR